MLGGPIPFRRREDSPAVQARRAVEIYRGHHLQAYGALYRMRYNGSMRITWTPSWIATGVLVAVIAVAVVRIPFVRPAADSVAFATGHHTVEGNVVDISRGERTAQVTLDDVTIAGDGTPAYQIRSLSDRVLVTAPRDLLPNIGDRVSVTCSLEAPEPFNGFAYDKYLAIRGVYAVCRVGDPLFVRTPGVGKSVSVMFTRTRMVFMDAIDRNLPQPQATLLSGLLLGSAEFSGEWRDRFLATGTSHIVAASGFNVSVVVLVLFSGLTMLGLRRQRAFWVLATAIVGYVALAGFSPAVVRAGVMGGLVLLAKKLGRKTTMRNVVLLAVAVMLTLEPRLFLYDVGFQLSVVSTVALIWIGPAFAERMKWIPTVLDLREVFASTLAATLCTLPLVVLTFGSVSLVGPLVNLLVLPFVPFAMAWGAVGLFINTAAPFPYVMIPAWGLLSVVLWVIRVTSAVPLLVVIPFAWRVVLAVCLACIIACVLWRKKLYVASSRHSQLRPSSSR